MIEALRALRDDLHARAFNLHARGLSEAAQALWSVVESLDDLLTRTESGHAHGDD